MPDTHTDQSGAIDLPNGWQLVHDRRYATKDGQVYWSIEWWDGKRWTLQTYDFRDDTTGNDTYQFGWDTAMEASPRKDHDIVRRDGSVTLTPTQVHPCVGEAERPGK